MVVVPRRGAAAQGTAPAIVSGLPGVQVLESDLDGALLVFRAPEPCVDTTLENRDAYTEARVDGYQLASVPGSPQLPVKGFMVGVPPDAKVELRLVDATQEVLAGRYRVLPAPRQDAQVPSPARWQSPSVTNQVTRTVTVEENPGIYDTDAYHPDAPVHLLQTAYIRHQRMAQLVFYPLQMNPVSGEVLFTSRVVVELAFEYPEATLDSANMGAVPEPESFERALRSRLVNYESARQWRQAPSGEPKADPEVWPGSLDPAYRLEVHETGMYRLAHDDLAAALLPGEVDSLDPRTFQIYSHDQELAILVTGEEDGSFDQGDYLLFYGEAISGKYEKYVWDNVYWLTYGQASGLRMAEPDGTPNGADPSSSFEQTYHYEENVAYWSEMPGDDPDFPRWYWTYTVAPGDIVDMPILPDVVSGPATAAIEVAMYGYENQAPNPEHHVAVYVNENWVGEFEWDGMTAYFANFSFPQSYLEDGSNTIRFQALLNPGLTYDLPFLDWYRLSYQRSYVAEGNSLSFSVDASDDWEVRVSGFTSGGGEPRIDTFDVTDPMAVSQVINTVVELDGANFALSFGGDTTGVTRYWSGVPLEFLTPLSIELDTPSALRGTAQGADYIMITHEDFYADILPLAEYYANTVGYRVSVVKAQDIYDEFSGGILYPGAIREFLAYAYSNWPGDAPAYALLVGDGHYDFKNNSTSTNLDQYIPPYMAYVDPYIGETAADNRYVCIVGDDIFPDMALGRFPVNSSAEAQAMVNKTLGYQQSLPGGDWNLNCLFATDNPDGAGNFYDLSDEVADNHVPEPYQVDKVYYGRDPYLTVADTRNAIKAAISEGRLFVSYVGHAAIPWWADEKLLRTGDIADLTNADRWPIMLPMTCQEGQFSNPYSGFPSFSETIVRADGKGAVASWAPTGWGVVAGHDLLQKGFFEAVFYDDVDVLGDAVNQAKLFLWNSGGGGYLDMIDTYVLLGDPALQINLAQPTGVVLASFTAEGELDGSVAVHWETVSEARNVGFNLHRAESPAGPRVLLNVGLIPSQSPPGSPMGASYEFVDGLVQPGNTYYYWLEDVDVYGAKNMHGPASVNIPIPITSPPVWRVQLPLILGQR